MTFNIVFATDKNYIQHLGVAVCSLLENNKDSEFDIYILNNGIDTTQYKKLETIVSRYGNTKLINIEIDDSMFEKLITNCHFTKANYYRLLISYFVKKPKCLYLDADIVVNGKIDGLYCQDINEYYLAAVENPGFERHKELKMNENSKYFNSGVMLINILKWEQENLKENVVKFVFENKEAIKFVDQCGLNAIVNGQWKKIELKYNQQAVIFEKDFEKKYSCFSKEELENARKNPIIIHFTGSSKPWHFFNRHPYKSFYWKYLKLTPFRYYFPEDLKFKNLVNILKKKLKFRIL
ncbi:lipopolysaccharide biosynthesis glycosyltransferase [Methanococcus maripaludis]|uniref:Lipopolysaccharide biosynthesis glycosyltransferase n=1 Tax=Methanococcus maripaludis TaxID=39152 RepID=A0A7J9NPJ6_METMI|nr:glycosyltransferase family 8 protein [Methanococcus maripaludis]MBA2846979.1 lipopolysaccharide biosynthesis glycosyltransferase [Methanococcus maripaludis]